MTTIWKPDSCHCEIAIPTPYDESNAIFIKQCRTHNRVSETFTHNRTFNKDSQIGSRNAEKRKPEFQRR